VIKREEELWMKWRAQNVVAMSAELDFKTTIKPQGKQWISELRSLW